MGAQFLDHRAQTGAACAPSCACHRPQLSTNSAPSETEAVLLLRVGLRLLRLVSAPGREPAGVVWRLFTGQVLAEAISQVWEWGRKSQVDRFIL